MLVAIILLPRVSLALRLSFLFCQLLLPIGGTSGISTKNEEVSMGTTILAVRFQGGVVAGADTRTSVSGYVSNRYAAKLTFVLERDVDNFVVTRPLSSFSSSSSSSSSSPDAGGTEIDDFEASTCVICRSGSAADTQKLASVVRSELVSRQLIYRIRGTVTHVAALLRTLLLHDDNSNMSASLICAGYDHELGRGVIYTVGPGGVVFEEKLWAAGGSGSSYILGHIDSWYQNHHLLHERNVCTPDDGEEMMMMPLPSEEEAIEFVSNAIQLAMERDGSSGGFIRMYVIDRFGKRFVSNKMMTSPATERNVGGIDDSRRNAIVLRNFAPAVSPSSR